MSESDDYKTWMNILKDIDSMAESRVVEPKLEPERSRERLRDDFAMAALPACLSGSHLGISDSVRRAYRIADDMLLAREGKL